MKYMLWLIHNFPKELFYFLIGYRWGDDDDFGVDTDGDAEPAG